MVDPAMVDSAMVMDRCCLLARWRILLRMYHTSSASTQRTKMIEMGEEVSIFDRRASILVGSYGKINLRRGRTGLRSPTGDGEQLHNLIVLRSGHS